MLTRRSALAGLAAGLAGAAPLARALERAPLPVPRPGGLEGPTGEAADLMLRAGFSHSGPSGWLAVDLDTGEVLSAHDPDRTFAPASVAKLVTAAFALDRLGPAHRFETRLLAAGTVSAGTLQGDLVLAGGGDPELDTDALAPLATALREAGITRVSGRFIVASEGLEVPQIDPEQPVEVAYNPGVATLSLNYNRVRLKWGRQAGPTRLSVTAMADRRSPPIDSQVRVEPWDMPRGQVLHGIEGGREVWRLPSRALRGEGGLWLPVKRPAAYAGEVFRALAAEQGAELPRPERGAVPAAARVLGRARSRPLSGVAADMLRYSTNVTAELLGVAAARAAGAAPDSLAASAALMNAWMAQTAGASPGDPRITFANHSGLTVQSRVAPSRMVALLAAIAARRPVPGEARHPVLPGGLAALLDAERIAAEGDGIDHARLEVRAKTGTMDYVRGLSGYIATPGGKRLAFAVFSNDLGRRRGGVRRIDSRWMASARAFEEALLRNWVRRADAEAKATAR